MLQLKHCCPFRLTLAFAGLIVGIAPSASAAVRHVDAGLASGANDGTSWANAYQGKGGGRR